MSRCRCGRGRGCHCRLGAAGFGGRLGHRVLHGVDVLFGHRALRGVGGLCHHGAPVVARVDGSDAYRAEAEPFTAKRSGTG